MTDKEAILYACAIEGDGNATLLSGEAISQTLRDDKLAWVHLNALAPETRSWLEREITYLDSLIIDALLAEETRPRLLEFGDGALLILRGVNLNENAAPEDMVSVRLWVDAHRIISVQRRSLKAVEDIQDQLATGRGPKNAGDFVAMLVARLFERMESTFSTLDEQLDDMEELVMDSPDTKERSPITDVRKQAILFRRYIMPQRDAIAQLRLSGFAWLDQTHKRHLQESLDRVIRYIEDLDAIRERAQIVKDELTTALSDRMNRNLYVLSVIAAIFLPLGFLTGLLGINVAGIPGADNAQAFWIFSAMLIALVTVQVTLFKLLRWF